MSEYVTTIIEYSPRQVDRKDGSGSFTLHKFKDVNGTELVARQDVANLVKGYLNQPLRVTVRSEQNGQYTNHYLDHAEPAGQQTLAPPQQPMPGPTGYQPQPLPGTYQPAAQAQAAQPQPIPPPTPPPPLPHQIDAGKDQAIHRQTAAKVAAQLSTTSTEFWKNVVDLAFYFDTGAVPSTPPQEDGIPF